MTKKQGNPMKYAVLCRDYTGSVELSDYVETEAQAKKIGSAILAEADDCQVFIYKLEGTMYLKKSPHWEPES